MRKNIKKADAPKYVLEACDILEKSFTKYMKDTSKNYVIIQADGTPVTWYNRDKPGQPDYDHPVVYGGVEDAQDDMESGDKLITERQYIYRYLVK